eukprot:5293945-Prymnesium_polylepis.1
MIKRPGLGVGRYCKGRVAIHDGLAETRAHIRLVRTFCLARKLLDKHCAGLSGVGDAPRARTRKRMTMVQSVLALHSAFSPMQRRPSAQQDNVVRQYISCALPSVESPHLRLWSCRTASGRPGAQCFGRHDATRP